MEVKSLTLVRILDLTTGRNGNWYIIRAILIGKCKKKRFMD